MGKPPPYRLTEPVEREHPMQAALKRVLDMEIAPAGHLSDAGACWWSYDIADYRGVPGTRVARGVVSGMPDVWVLWNGTVGGIELKAKDGSLEESQRVRLPILRQAGMLVGVASDPWQVLRILDAWGVPRSRRTHPA